MLKSFACPTMNQFMEGEYLGSDFLKIFCEVFIVQWLSSKKTETANRVQILDEADCISHNTNALEKCMNPIILPQAMSKW